MITGWSQLAEQPSIVDTDLRTAVDDFVRDKDSGSIPSQLRRYTRLLPATAPSAGQQHAFRVDLDRCSGCKACVTACHSLNGLDETETWREVGLLIGGSTQLPVIQHVTTACHHCIDPGCLSACPVDAYEKDPATGIVRHLDDQCFGCQYCTFACPYDVPQYNAAKGIVRKCDMCSDRLAAGEPPACVQACPHEAITIRVVDVQQVIDDSETNLFLPGAPDPTITYPTTTYETERVFPRNTRAADYHTAHPQHAHWPLAIMLVLTQLSVGAFLVGFLLESIIPGDGFADIRPINSVIALAFGLLALTTSVLHLGRPWYAFRAVIGLRHSWLSREIVAFGAFAASAACYSIANFAFAEPNLLTRVLGALVGISGIVGVVCSVMVYAVTQRDLWNGPATSARFGLTTAILGVAATLVCFQFGAAMVPDQPGGAMLLATYGADLCRLLMVLTVVKLTMEASQFRHLRARTNTPQKRSAQLLSSVLSRLTWARFVSGLLGGLGLPLLLARLLASPTANPYVDAMIVALLFAACLTGELLERHLFFVAVASPRMPGPLRG